MRFDDDTDDNKMFIIDSAIKNKLGTKEEIELYEELCLALELMKSYKDFCLIGSCIGNGLEFEIVARYPKPLPEKIGALFFNIDTKFTVTCKESNTYISKGRRHFHIKIKKFNNV